MNLEDLKKPFSVNDIEWRVQRDGMKNSKPWAMVLAYVTNRAIQNRLDEVCGPESWQNRFKAGPQGGVLCGISIKVKDEWIIKWDGADNTKIEPVKGGLSDAMKRAGYQWGIGRYLYNLHDNWAKFITDGCYKCKIENKWYEWNPPALLPEFLPEEEREPQKKPKPATKKKDASEKESTSEQKEESSFSKGIKEMREKCIEMFGKKKDTYEESLMKLTNKWDDKGNLEFVGIASLGELKENNLKRFYAIKKKIDDGYEKFKEGK